MSNVIALSIALAAASLSSVSLNAQAVRATPAYRVCVWPDQVRVYDVETNRTCHELREKGRALADQDGVVAIRSLDGVAKDEQIAFEASGNLKAVVAQITLTSRRTASPIPAVFTGNCSTADTPCASFSFETEVPISLRQLLSVSAGNSLALTFRHSGPPVAVPPLTLAVYGASAPAVVVVDQSGAIPPVNGYVNEQNELRPIVFRNQVDRGVTINIDLDMQGRDATVVKRTRCADGRAGCSLISLPAYGEFYAGTSVTRIHSSITATADDADGAPLEKVLASGAPGGAVLATVDLTNLGVLAPFRNPRNPKDVSNGGTNGVIVFHNTTLDRTFVVTFTIGAALKKEAVDAAPQFGFKVGDCSDKTCIVIQLAPGTQLSVPASVLLPTTSTDPVAKFNVDFAYTGAAKPTNNIGYLKVLDKPLVESQSRSISGSLSFTESRAPQLDAWSPVTAGSYDGQITQSGSALSSVQASSDNGWIHTQGTVTGSTGLGTSNRNVTVSEFSATLYTPRGVTFTGGRTDVSSPAFGVGIKVSGDSLRVNIPATFMKLESVTVAGVILRESETGKADVNNGDKKLLLVEVGPFGGKQTGSLDNVTLTALYGEDRALRYRFWTGGATVHFGSGNGLMSGTVGGFLSGRKPLSGSLVTEGRGGAFLALMDISVTRNETKRSIDRVLRFSTIGGTGDDAGTPRDEGYTGETMSFSTSGIFPSSLAKHFSTDGYPVGANLRNLNFTSIEFLDSTWSALDWLLGVMQVPQSERKDRQTSIKVVQYRQQHLTFAGAGRNLGNELILSTRITGPKNIGWTASLSKYFAPSSLESTFKDLPFQLSLLAKIGF